MPSSDHFKSITLSGFRGYLYEQTLDLQDGKSLVIYSPNGKGKSSLVDAIEFFFSSGGTVARLGERRTSIQGGREALVHDDALTRNIDSFVKAGLNIGGSVVSFQRQTNTPEALPTSIAKILRDLKVPFIIRGFELRNFVENESPADRYESVSRWFGFSDLVKTQNGLRKLRLNLNREISNENTLREIDRMCSTTTENQRTTWNEGQLLEWYREKYLDILDPSAEIQSFEKSDPISNRLAEESRKEQEVPNVSSHKTISAKLTDLAVPRSKDEKTLPVKSQQAVNSYFDEISSFEKVKADSQNAIFKGIWAEARSLLANKTLQIDECPVCETEFSSTASGSRENVEVRLGVKLSELKTFSAAEKNLNDKKLACESSIRNLKAQLSSILAISDSIEQNDISAPIREVNGKLELGQDRDTTMGAVEEAQKVIAQSRATIDSHIEEIEKKVKSVTWKKAKEDFDKLVELRNQTERLFDRKRKLESKSQALESQANLIDSEIKSYVHSLIGALAVKTNEFYSEIQKGEERIPKIHLELPPESRRVQNALELLIDFSDNRKGVPPAGYLSDSQIHSLALSLRLAAINLFNKDFPLIVLDDVVTSYDSDHRQAIAAMLAKHTQEQQVVLVTHDEQFFQLLNEHLSRSAWIFKRITKLDLAFGPKYADHRIKDDQIDSEHDNGNSAANLMRQAEEEWLTDICRGFQVDLKIRPVNRPYNFSRSELAIALHRFLKDKDLTPPESNTYQNPFLLTLQSGTVENSGSHFSDSPYGSGSIGDEKRRWVDFKEFRGYFFCSNCGRKKFVRPDEVTNPICKSCSTPFKFQ